MRKKCLFIGIDGGDWNILDILINQGYLPNLARLKKSGRTGILNSTIPELTAPAWSSLLTGVNPGKHGVFYWQSPWRIDKPRKLLTNSDIKAKQLPQFLSEKKVTVGLLNFPFSYPVKKVNGYQVSGMLSPAIDKRSVYPKEIILNLKQIGYQVGDILPQTSDKIKIADFFENLKVNIEKRTEAFLKLNYKFQPQFMGIVFVAVDRVNHLLFREIYSWLTGEKYSLEYQDLIAKAFEVYKKLDYSVGEILNSQKFDLIIVASDHGFKKIDNRVNISKAFIENGWLTPKIKTDLIYQLYRFSPRKIDSVDLRFKIREFLSLARSEQKKSDQLPILGKNQLRDSKREEAINLDKSKLVPAKSAEQGVYLLDESIKEDVVSLLRNIKDPENGLNIFDEVGAREDIYRGNFLNDAPDIVFNTKDQYYQYSPVLLKQPLINDWKYFSGGEHRKKGIFLISGDLGGNVGDEANIWDITPTILKFFDICRPSSLDGRSLL